MECFLFHFIALSGCDKIDDMLSILKAYPSNPPRPITKDHAHHIPTVSLNAYYVSNGSKIVPAGFENNSVKNRSASSPFA